MTAAMAAALLNGWGNLVNDLTDIRSDSINHPERPLPSGKIKVPEAYLLAATVLILAVLLSLFASVTAFLILTAAAIMLLVYSLLVKGIPVLSAVWVAVLTGMVFIYAGSLAGSYSLFQFNLVNSAALFAFWFHLARELVKDLADFSGDVQAGRATLANLTPSPVSKAVASSAFVMILIVAVMVAIFLKPGVLFSVLFIIGVIGPVVLISIRFWKASKSDEYRRVAFYLKLVMPAGLLIIMSARL
jgi:geranylgeranylglycerol-phosphate geranylgeranyltransferase